jgi:hypothetical protein
VRSLFTAGDHPGLMEQAPDTPAVGLAAAAALQVAGALDHGILARPTRYYAVPPPVSESQFREICRRHHPASTPASRTPFDSGVRLVFVTARHDGPISRLHRAPIPGSSDRCLTQAPALM